MLQLKVAQNLIFYKKLYECISVSTPGVKLGGYKGLRFWNIIMLWNEKFSLEQNTAKNIDYIEKCVMQKLHRIKFAAKNSMDAYVNLPLEWN